MKFFSLYFTTVWFFLSLRYNNCSIGCTTKHEIPTEKVEVEYLSVAVIPREKITGTMKSEYLVTTQLAGAFATVLKDEIWNDSQRPVRLNIPGY